MNKIIKYISTSALAVMALGLTSCNDDESLDRKGKPSLTIANFIGGNTYDEGESASLNFELSYAIQNPAHFRIEATGGSAVEGEDYVINATTIADAGANYFGGDGYFLTIPAYEKSFIFTDFIEFNDNFNAENEENIIFSVYPASKGEAFASIQVEVKISAHGAKCAWIVEATDLYGDGWFGTSSIEVEKNGDLIDTIVVADSGNTYTPTTETYEYLFEEGDNYSFTYTSGGGAGAPEYEEENEYVVTSPDGTIFQDGQGYAVPTGQVITSGTNTCQ